MHENVTSIRRLLTGAAFSALATMLWAQRTDAQFTTILNVPPDNAGSSVGAGTQLNLFDGGMIRFFFNANSGSEVNVHGGIVDSDFRANAGSVVNIAGGRIGDEFNARDGSEVNISGGSFGDEFTSVRAMLSISGGAFRLNGELIGAVEQEGSSAVIDVGVGDLLSGTLADGTPFAFLSPDGDLLFGGVTLHSVALPTIGPVLITASTDPVGLGIRQGQTLRVDSGSTIADNFNAGQGSTVDVVSGSVGINFEATGSAVNITGGAIGNAFDAFHGSEVNISGGSIGSDSEIHHSVVNVSGGEIGVRPKSYSSTVNINDGMVGFGYEALDSTVNISGGLVGSRFETHFGSDVNLTGGSIDNGFIAYGGNVTLSGGTVGDMFESRATTHLSGGEFRLDDTPIEELANVGSTQTVDVPESSVLSGTFADGTPFAFTSQDGDAFFALTLTTVELPPVGPALITASTEHVPLGIRQGQTLIVDDGGFVPNHFGAGQGSRVDIESGGRTGRNFEAVGAEVNLHGGSIGTDFDAHAGSVVNILDGSIDDHMQAYPGSVVNISGGSVGFRFEALDDSVVNVTKGDIDSSFRSSGTVTVSGGTVGHGFVALDGSVIEVSGGRIGVAFEAGSGSTVNISGGSITSEFSARGGSEVNVFGTEFAIDGEDIVPSLTLGVPLIVEDRDVLLTGVLRDGSPFAFDLDSQCCRGFVALDAMLSITLSLPLGDFNLNGELDAADMDTLSLAVLDGSHDITFDITGDGQVDHADRSKWIDLKGTAFGDANLDLAVDETDFALWQKHAFTVDRGWATADFNGDAITDVSDFNIWNQNRGFRGVAASVPEPVETTFLLLFQLPLILSRRRR